MHKTRSQVLLDHKPDGFRIYLLVLICTIIFCSLMCLFLFLTESAVGYAVFMYELYALYAVELVSLLYGIFSRRIKLGAYKYHIALFLLQLLTTAGSILFVLYKLADSLSSF